MPTDAGLEQTISRDPVVEKKTGAVTRDLRLNNQEHKQRDNDQRDRAYH